VRSNCSRCLAHHSRFVSIFLFFLAIDLTSKQLHNAQEQHFHVEERPNDSVHVVTVERLGHSSRIAEMLEQRQTLLSVTSLDHCPRLSLR
jgi:hypothetical protein